MKVSYWTKSFVTLLTLLLAACAATDPNESLSEASNARPKSVGEKPSKSIPYSTEVTDAATFSTRYASGHPLSDGTFVYNLNVELNISSGICVPEILTAAGLYNAGSFIEGKDLEGQKFDFEAKIDSWRVENNSAKFLAPPNAVLDIEFRSGRKASEIRAYFPISPCTASHRIDWSYGEGNWLETEWVLIRYVK